MSGLEKLKKIGAHKIFEQTHISKKYVQDILNEDFSSLNKVQFSGFISILEREYHVDLAELNAAYGLPAKEEEPSKKEPFVVSFADDNSKKGLNKTLLVVGFAVGIAVLVTVLNFSTSAKKIKAKQALKVPVEVVNEPQNNTIEEAKKHLNKPKLEEEQVVVEEVSVEPIHPTKLMVTPRSNLWVGIVDLETFKRKQELGSTPFDLDPDKEWLLVMGHGFVSFEVNGEEKKFSDKNKVWFAYEDGSLSQITRSEFKEKNRGKAW